ncbi:universal stress protein [Rhizobium sp. PL01]|uniref:universal stress protein n=1 Tax=Rhizobium sp. PL01 TaxID=3085631 RepID=UPI0029811C46|nr:universal stress protein [Rhizobium sp. PL01]MDW5317488.1 universal stress protein [Rhizobium sp. PL01]
MKLQFHLPLMTYPDATSFTLLQNAVEVASNESAHLNVNVHQVKAPYLSPPFPTMLDIEKLKEEAEWSSRNAGTVLKTTLHDYAEEAGVAISIGSFECAETFVGSRIAELSRVYDLNILEASEIGRPIIECVLFESGRPLLLFPTDMCPDRFATIAIAWDGSQTLARALTGARAFLGGSSKVILISVNNDKTIDTNNRDQYATVLRNSGLPVDIISAQSAGLSPAITLQAVAKENGANLLVAGGFGQSRFREFILGGVTRSLLGNLDMPVLLSH